MHLYFSSLVDVQPVDFRCVSVDSAKCVRVSSSENTKNRLLRLKYNAKVSHKRKFHVRFQPLVERKKEKARHRKEQRFTTSAHERILGVGFFRLFSLTARIRRDVDFFCGSLMLATLFFWFDLIFEKLIDAPLVTIAFVWCSSIQRSFWKRQSQKSHDSLSLSLLRLLPLL